MNNFKNSANNYGCGGAIYATNSRTNNFISNTADNTSGSAIVAGNNTCMHWVSLVLVTLVKPQNIMKVVPLAQLALCSMQLLGLNGLGTNSFFNNSAKNGGAVLAILNILLSFIGTSCFSIAILQWKVEQLQQILTPHWCLMVSHNGHEKCNLSIRSIFTILPQTTV